VSHLTDDELVLHYYDEDGPDIVRVERHLETCVDCARAYERLSRTLTAVTPPAVVEAPDDTIALRQLLLERVHDRESLLSIALAWLVPLVYPWSPPAIFAAAQSSHGPVLVGVALLWACAGPAIALVALQRGRDRFDRLTTRLRVLGAVVATITPPLFLVVRGGQRLDWWYGAIAVAALLALGPWPAPAGSTPRLKRLHRLSSLLLGLYILGHIVNQALAFVSVESYAAMRGVMRLASQQSVSYVAIIAMVVMQIATGAAMGVKKVTAGALARNVQVVSGWYLAVFLFSHVCSPYLAARPVSAAPVAQSLTPPHLLTSASSAASLPFYLLGVSAFLLHIGLYARLAALTWLPDASVRRLSYAGAIAGALVVATVGLSLCGIHILR
jgi:hypothetical protein